MTDVEYAELHTPLFLGGTNLSQKLDPNKRTGLILKYDDDKRRLIVQWNNKTANIPEANVASYVEGKIEPKKIATVAKDAMVGSAPHKFTAQVTTPQAHVFAGPGGGKSK